MSYSGDSDFVFQNGTTDPLKTLLFTNFDRDQSTYYVLVDDIYVYNGVNLSDPGEPPVFGCDTGEYLAMDLNQDCYVDTADLEMFLENWVKCNNPADANCTEF